MLTSSVHHVPTAAAPETTPDVIASVQATAHTGENPEKVRRRSRRYSACSSSAVTAELLRTKPQSPLLRSLTNNEIRILSAGAELRKFSRRQLLLKQGEPAKNFGLILEGTVRFMNLDPSGNMSLLSILHSGESFGWQSFPSNTTSLFEGRAVSDCRVVVWENSELQSILRIHSSIALHFVQECAERLIYLLRRSLILATSPAEDRLRHAIAELAKSFGTPANEGVLLAGFSEEEVAAMAGLSRYTVSHLLAKWREEGWIAVNRREILIQDPHLLGCGSPNYSE